MAIRLPAEHGAWGILLVPLLASAALARGTWLPFMLVTSCALGLFLLRGSCEQHRSFRALLSADHLLLGLATLASGAALVFYFERGPLLAVAAMGGALFLVHRQLMRRHEAQGTEKRSLAAELVGVLLLTLAAPATWIAQRGALNAQGATVWLLNVLFFAGGVLYVKYRVRGLLVHRPFVSVRERAEFAWPVFVYHVLLALFLIALVAVDSLSLLVVVAFAPAILRANGLLFHLGQRFPIKRLGWSEMGHAVLFAALLLLALR
jgi:hypothetical protein